MVTGLIDTLVTLEPKTKVAQLALFGGAPAFAEALHVGRPNVPQGQARAHLLDDIADIFDRQWLTNHGPVVREFERQLACLTETRHAIAVCNATQGLQVAAHACGLTGEVIVPAFTFIATAHALSWIGLTPVFADVDAATHTLDPAQIERLITPRTSAILATHLWGTPCQTDALADLARRHRLQVLYDAAHAFGCSHQGRMLGSFGRAEVFSFHATKFVNAAEGGAITTDDDELAARMRRMVSFGFEDYDRVADLGTNAKMNELSAALGLTSLARTEELIAINRANYRAYRAGLAGLAGVRLLPYAEAEQRNYQYVVLEIAGAALTRDELLEILWAEGVKARRYFFPGCHRMEPYRSRRAGARSKRTLPVTERLANSVLVLPTGAAVSATDIARLCQLLEFVLTQADEVKWKLATVSRT
jgi:dTDP-4-amino-4,6-dideoxygalactose transaminase